MMHKFNLPIVIMLASFMMLLSFSCGNSSTENATQDENTAMTPQDKPATFSDAKGANTKDDKNDYNSTSESNSPLLNDEAYQRIYTLLPQEANGVQGGAAEGWLSGENGPKYTYAKRAYRNSKNKSRVDLGIQDAGTKTVKSLNLIAYWSGKNIDTKTVDGHEKTLTYKDFPAFEKCGKQGCDLMVAVDDRFVLIAYVNHNVELKDRFSVFDVIDINQLRQLPK